MAKLIRFIKAHIEGLLIAFEVGDHTLKDYGKFRGKCKQCGKCCKGCPFLNKHNRCSIYAIRPLGCKFFPRDRKMRLRKGCGFKW